MNAATSSYNKPGAAGGGVGVRIGNWVEEVALGKVGMESSQFKGATFERCIAHSDQESYSRVQSLNKATYSRDVSLVTGVPAAARCSPCSSCSAWSVGDCKWLAFVV